MGSCMTVSGQPQEPLFKAPPLLKPRASMALRRQSKKKGRKPHCTGVPQGCVLFSLIFIPFYAKICTSRDSSIKCPKSANNMGNISLIGVGNECAYRL